MPLVGRDDVVVLPLGRPAPEDPPGALEREREPGAQPATGVRVARQRARRREADPGNPPARVEHDLEHDRPLAPAVDGGVGPAAGRHRQRRLVRPRADRRRARASRRARARTSASGTARASSGVKRAKMLAASPARTSAATARPSTSDALLRQLVRGRSRGCDADRDEHGSRRLPRRTRYAPRSTPPPEERRRRRRTRRRRSRRAGRTGCRRGRAPTPRRTCRGSTRDQRRCPASAVAWTSIRCQYSSRPSPRRPRIRSLRPPTRNTSAEHRHHHERLDPASAARRPPRAPRGTRAPARPRTGAGTTSSYAPSSSNISSTVVSK